MFGLVWSNYFDDYPLLDLAASQNDSQVTAERLLDLLGWKLSQKETKRRPFDFTFDALGVTFDFTRCKFGEVVVRNKASRVLQVSAEIESILQKGSFPTKAASALRGKLQFAEAHTFGRILSSSLRAFQNRATGKDAGESANAALRLELEWANDFTQSNRPRTLRCDMDSSRLVIFTDASLEGSDACGGIGMVAVHVVGGVARGKFFFSDVFPPSLLSKWQSRPKKIIASQDSCFSVRRQRSRQSFIDSHVQLHPLAQRSP